MDGMLIACLKKSVRFLFLAMAIYSLPIEIQDGWAQINDAELDLKMRAEGLKLSGYYGKASSVTGDLLALQTVRSDNDGTDTARTLDFLGELQYLAGKYPEAELALQKSLAIRETLFGAENIETAETHHHLGTVYALMANDQAATSHFSTALQIRQTALSQDHPDVAETLVGLARVYINTDRLDQAESLLKRALAMQEKSLGPEHPDLVYTLNTLAWMHVDTDDFEKSEPFSKRALKISENTFGPDHPFVADSLNYLARLYYSRGEYDQSILANQRALAIREKFLGPDHPDVGLSLNNLALPYCGLEQYETARGLFTRSLSIREKALGPEHPYLLVILQNTGWVYKVLGDNAGAIPFIKRALGLGEKTLDPESTSLADMKKDLAELYYSLGNYEQAKPLLEQSLAIYGKTLGPDHTRVALNLSLIAFIYHRLGEHPKAEQFYNRSIEICEKNFEKSPANLASNLISLGALYVDMGEYEKAEPLYDRALNILEKASGPDHSSIAYILNNKADLYRQLADYDKAEANYIRAISIWEKTFGPEHPNVAVSLDNLATIYQHMGRYEKAKPLYQRALKIREKTVGSSHPDVSRTLNNLATLYTLEGSYENAEQLYQQVLQAKRDTIGSQTYSYANSLSNLAYLYERQNDLEKAESLYEQTIGIWEKTLGPEHPHVATGLAHLCDVQAGMGKTDKAYDALMRSLNIEGQLVDQVLGFTSEDQKLKFIAQNSYNVHRLINLVNQYFKNDPVKSKESLNIWLTRKGSILEVQRLYQQAIFSAGDLKSIRLFQDLSEVRSELSKLAFSLPDSGEDQGYMKRMEDLKKEKDQLEARLSRSSQPFAMKQQVAGADSVSKALPSESVLVEFARIETMNFNAKQISEPDRYICFVLFSGDGNTVRIVDLGDAEKIDNLIAEHKNEISGSKNIGNGSLKQLYDLVFKPLLPVIGRMKNIFISPDGNLNLIPFEIMQGPDDRYLIEDYTFNYLASGKDLIAFEKEMVSGVRYLLMGDPYFNLGLDEKQEILKRIDFKNDTGIHLAIRSSNLTEVNFEPLRYAGEELNAIGKIMGIEKSDIYTGKKALEEILWSQPAPEILHLATHGFFLSDQNPPSSGRGWDSADFPGIDEPSPHRIQRKINVENPLLRSGIFLAGAKRSLLTGDTGNNDGIVTAEKILGMNLRGTKMVVLSACDTGLGEVKSGEGVFGLRRAFTQAGAKSLVMSLWKVPDKETKELMVQFYRNIKTGTMNRCQALRQAALQEMQIVKRRYGHANPRYWGAFVFMGEP